ncbi:hypothetical protein G6F68_018110 [Rhizopus microsporus]|nr:hypothetical protein G6F68_018110 [Rhizopus microsporus]
MTDKTKKSEKKKPATSRKKEKAQQREIEKRNAVMLAFNKYYEEEWGSERWPVLLEALQKPVRHCMLINKYANIQELKTKLEPTLADLTMLDFLRLCRRHGLLHFGCWIRLGYRSPGHSARGSCAGYLCSTGW